MEKVWLFRISEKNAPRFVNMVKQWDKIFKQYGKFFTKPQEDIPKIVKLFKKKGVKRVLDLGCGSGRHTVYLAKQGFEVYGFDIAPKGIKLAKDWLKKNNLKANLKIGSIYKKLPYKNNFFDAVISVQTIHHAKIKTIRKVIKEIERALKPKGFIFITVAASIPRKVKRWKHKIIEPRTIIPVEGREKGLIHYFFNKELLRKEFRNFKIYDIWVDSGDHYCFLGELKNKNVKN